MKNYPQSLMHQEPIRKQRTLPVGGGLLSNAGLQGVNKRAFRLVKIQ